MEKIEKAEIIIVNEKDEIIWYKKRWTLEKEDIYRVSALWLINSKWEILLAQRAFTKKHHPGMVVTSSCWNKWKMRNLWK